VSKFDVDERRPSCYYGALRICKSDVSSVQCLLIIDTIYPGFKPEPFLNPPRRQRGDIRRPSMATAAYPGAVLHSAHGPVFPTPPSQCFLNPDYRRRYAKTEKNRNKTIRNLAATLTFVQ
jgi:hypothetical protein